ncbi:MAG: 3-phosphoglycerate dehydrogenase [Chloroflexi bacterium]|nr:3-phosphoglycerate dehydrogenase [Chloroflexota bacterium]
MKCVLVLAPLTSAALGTLRQRLRVAYEPWTETRRLWDPAELAQRLAQEEIGAVIIEADFLFGEVFEGGSPLRFVGLCRNATNQVDLEAATRRGVVVVNTPGRNAPAVAELTIGLLLALARRLPQVHAYVQQGRWQNPVEPYLTLQGVELAGKTLGLVGLGAIGRQVARRARALGMHVLAADPHTSPLRGVTLTDLDTLLRQSDFISLHAADTQETRGMLGAAQLALMKPTSFLVNTASASLVDSAALVAALRAGRLAGAALDVFEAAPLPLGSPLLGMDNVLLTPHMGGATDGTVERYSRMVAEDLLRFLDGKRPRHIANPEVWRVRAPTMLPGA